jgi:hypothetical protein
MKTDTSLELHCERDESDIEVTPDMIKVGLHELSYYDPKEDSVEFAVDVVVAIFRAMKRQGHMMRGK